LQTSTTAMSSRAVALAVAFREGTDAVGEPVDPIFAPEALALDHPGGDAWTAVAIERGERRVHGVLAVCALGVPQQRVSVEAGNHCGVADHRFLVDVEALDPRGAEERPVERRFFATAFG